MPEKPDKRKTAVSIYTSIPTDVYDRIHELAKKNRRSIASQLAVAIEEMVAREFPKAEA